MNDDILNETNNIPLLRASDVAVRLNISNSLAYQLLQSGAIPTIRINRSVRVRPSDLDNFIERCRKDSKE
jgi:excisionase family DNA binding protein